MCSAGPGFDAGSSGFALPYLPLSHTAVDRSVDKREDEAWLEQAWRDPRSRVLVVGQGRAPVDASDQLVLVPPARAPDGARFLLGVEDGRAYFAVSAAESRVPGEQPSQHEGPSGGEGPAGVRAASLREVGGVLGDRDAGLMVHAVALQRWHDTHGYCPRCGAATDVGLAGHVRICPADGSQHFPRVDPAVIMLVRDADDRVLLARKSSWPEGRHSVLAGFVEPGESLEQAVGREVNEEVGLHVDAVRYMASQPWPFPSSLMLGFIARTSDTALGVDGDEIAEAEWFTRAGLRQATEDRAILLPPGTSIARRLIESWYGTVLPAAW